MPATQRQISANLYSIEELAVDEKRALDWYRSEPIPAFGGQTADSLVKSGKGAASIDISIKSLKAGTRRAL